MTELNEVSSTELPYPYKQQTLFQGDRIKSPAYAWYMWTVFKINLLGSFIIGVSTHGIA